MWFKWGFCGCVQTKAIAKCVDYIVFRYFLFVLLENTPLAASKQVHLKPHKHRTHGPYKKLLSSLICSRSLSLWPAMPLILPLSLLFHHRFCSDRRNCCVYFRRCILIWVGWITPIAIAKVLRVCRFLQSDRMDGKDNLRLFFKEEQQQDVCARSHVLRWKKRQKARQNKTYIWLMSVIIPLALIFFLPIRALVLLKRFLPWFLLYTHAHTAIARIIFTHSRLWFFGNCR